MPDQIKHGLLPGKIVDGNRVSWSITERMDRYDVPAASVAVIDDLKVRWAEAWGTKRMGYPEAVGPGTIFQTASVSKSVTAVGLLSLVADGLLDLDADIKEYLSDWHLPRGGYTEDVTLRRLLSHSAGTGVGGFAGYDRETGLPTLQQILNGESPANSPAVRMEVAPGTRFQYSGGGYLIVQQVMQHITGEQFADIMHDRVFEPLGMSNSFYAPLSDEQKQIAASGHMNGEFMPAYAPIHVESAAGGLWSTPTDLALLLIELMQAYRGESQTVIARDLVEEMLEQHFWSFGLGFRVLGEGDSLRFSHGGATRGWHSHVLAFPERGEGVVVMTNGENGWLLWPEIERAVSAALGWPIIRPQRIAGVELPAATMREYVGQYRLGDAEVSVVQTAESLLRFDLQNLALELIPTARDTFEIREIEGQAIFEYGEGGSVVGFDLWVGEPDWSPYRRWSLVKETN